MLKNILSLILLTTAFSQTIQAQAAAFRLNNYKFEKGKMSADKIIHGAEIGYIHPLNKVFDLYFPLRLGPRGDVETLTNAGKTKTTQIGNFGLDMNLQAKYDNGHNFLVPFLSAGVGTELYDNGLGFGAPLGGGLNFRITPKTFITLASSYRLAITKTSPKSWMNSIGIVVNLAKITKNEVLIPPVSKQENYLQKQKEAAQLKAEEDARAKLAAEEEAKAKMEKMALEKANTEAEAQAQAEAKAKALALATEEQKPVVVSAEVKKVLDYALKGVQFETGSALLTKESFSLLDEVATTMIANPELKIRIEGHTDRTGIEPINQKLSEARATTCLNYLISKGISTDRLKEIGYGSTRPVSDNETPEGRSQNRRVEFVPFK